MNHLRLIVFCCCLILFTLMLFKVSVVQAASDNVGGQVGTTGKISFYDEVSESPISDSNELNSKSFSGSNNNYIPNMGERVSNYIVVGLCLTLLTLLILFFRKRG